MFFSLFFRINFFRICRILLDDVPSVLRPIFKRKIKSLNHGRKWQDTNTSGEWLVENERWKKKLSQPQLDLLRGGDTKCWDGTLLVHILLHSSHCLFAEKVPNIQWVLKAGENKVSACMRGDFYNQSWQKRRVIFDLEEDQFCTEIAEVQESCLITKHIFQPHGSTPRSVDMYICQKEWCRINELARLRNTCYGHCAKACASSAELRNVVRDIEGIYRDLNVPEKCIIAMKAIENG